jgi:perosamine synthetase
VANTYIGAEEADAVRQVVASGWLSMGRRVQEFEEAFARAVGGRSAIAVNNGTTALQIALMALEIEGPECEVIVPSLTYISTANVVLYQNAKVVLCECDPITYNTTAEIVESLITDKTKAVIVVDMNGMPADYGPILELAEKHGIQVIADSAESLGATYKGVRVGGQAPIHTFSFFPNKNITTGEGGMIVVADDGLAERMRIIRNQGQDFRYHHIALGGNFRMTEMQASIGAVQLGRLDWLIREKEAIARRYDELLAECRDILAPHRPPYVTQHSWYMYAVRLEEGIDRDKVVADLDERGIETRLSFPPVHMQPYYQQRFGYRDDSFPISAAAWGRLIDIPMWVGLSAEQQETIVETLVEVCKTRRVG